MHATNPENLVRVEVSPLEDGGDLSLAAFIFLGVDLGSDPWTIAEKLVPFRVHPSLFRVLASSYTAEAKRRTRESIHAELDRVLDARIRVVAEVERLTDEAIEEVERGGLRA